MDKGTSANHIILGKKYTSISNMVRGFIYEKSLTMMFFSRPGTLLHRQF